MDDEKRRLQSTREEIGDSSGGRRIDLEAGKVSIQSRRRSNPTAAHEAEAVDAIDAAPEAEDLPSVALANDEAEIEPEVVNEEPPEPTAAAEPDDVPIDAPAPEPVAEAPRKKTLSASAWSRRG